MLHRTNHPLALPRLFARLGRAPGPIWLLGLLSTLSSTASAAQPTVEQCLQASDDSLGLETQEKLLATRDALRTCAALACPQEVRDECARRIELVEQNIPSVFCEVRDQTGHVRLDALITIDARTPAPASQELIELEPGAHTLTAQVPGGPLITQHVTFSAREKNRRVRFLVQDSALRRGLAPQKAAALVATGVGVASLATATVFAVIALNRKQDARALCPDATCPSELGAERWDSARQAGNFSTGFAVGGVLALGTAAALWLSFEQRNTTVSLGPAQVQLKATF